MSYERFDPPRRLEEYAARLSDEVMAEAARARMTRQPCKYLIAGEHFDSAGNGTLDVAVNRAWVVANSDHRLIEGRLRWQCPSCGKLSGTHAKACGYE